MSAKHITFMDPFTLDLTTLKTKLVDVEDGGLQGYRTERAARSTSMPARTASA